MAMLGERLAEARRVKGLTQAELAVALGDRYTQSMISQVERGNSSLLVDGLINAAKELNVSTDYLLGLADDPTPAFLPLPAIASHEDADANKERRGEDFKTDTVEIQRFTGFPGDNAGNVAQTKSEPHPVRASCLKELRVDPRFAGVVQIQGHSMSPDLPNGCLVLVDQNRNSRELIHNLIYLIAIGNATLEIRRLRGLVPSDYQWHTDFFLDLEYGGRAWLQHSWRSEFWYPRVKADDLLIRNISNYEPIPHDRWAIQVIGQVRCVLERSFDNEGW